MDDTLVRVLYATPYNFSAEPTLTRCLEIQQRKYKSRYRERWPKMVSETFRVVYYRAGRPSRKATLAESQPVLTSVALTIAFFLKTLSYLQLFSDEREERIVLYA